MKQSQEEITTMKQAQDRLEREAAHLGTLFELAPQKETLNAFDRKRLKDAEEWLRSNSNGEGEIIP